jgi:U3 small nucleolar RNA-associated protein 25
VFSILNSYRDLNLTERNHENGEAIRLVYTLHVLNHILKTRTKIVNNNARCSPVPSNLSPGPNPTTSQFSTTYNASAEVGFFQSR